MVTIDSLYELTDAISNGTIANLLRTCSLKYGVPTPKICMAYYGQTARPNSYY